MTDELKKWFSDLVAELYQKDENYAVYGDDYDIDPQGGSRKGRDNADEPFFSFVNEDSLFQKPTYRKNRLTGTKCNWHGM